MSLALYTILLALIWTAITGSFTLANLFFGLILGVLALYLFRSRIGGPIVFHRARRIISLIILFFKELVMSAIRVAILVCRPNLDAHLKPGIIAFPLKVKSDSEIAVLANMITLTPGTLSVDVSEDRKFLYVHAIAVENKDDLIKDIAEGFEAKILEVSK